ncbi:MAG: biopolymer transporter ExbD [Sediminibacterium sp.]|nr:biopolymer transporter ExbD [Sediminibacterium sp.]
MAEMDTSSGGGHKKGPGVKKSKKLSTRVDLTPMVDLGFLLITFFIFTTTMSQPTAFKLLLPKEDVKKDDQNQVDKDKVLTILVGSNNHLYYYEGELDPKTPKINSANYSGENSIRDVIISKKERMNQIAPGSDKDLVIVIKCYKDATYSNLVSILDEMQININKKYALVKLGLLENIIIEQLEGITKTK